MAPTSSPQISIPFFEALAHLGSVLQKLVPIPEDNAGKIAEPEGLYEAILLASRKNPWFTEPFCRRALAWWGHCLNRDHIIEWLAPYQLPHPKPARIALILAGNVPVVGLHDLLAVLVTGHTAILKLSTKDDVLLPALIDIMAEVEPDIRSKVIWADGMLPDHDGVIATGSTNTSRYFEFYFGKKPHIIRKNRNAVAVLTGTESEADLQGLAHDLFLYFGMGCRNVSKLYTPNNFDLDKVIKAASSYTYLMDHHKYANNYEYHKAIYLMGEQPFTDGGYCLFLESDQIASPIATIHYETYDSIDMLTHHLDRKSDEIQCVVSQSGIAGEVDFGAAQKPGLMHYADGVDTVEFLLKTSFK